MTEFYPRILVFLQFTLIAAMLFFSQSIVHSPLGISIFILGLLLGLWALNHNKRGNFNIQPKIKEGCKLITSGAYKYIRHPMYSSVTLMMLGVLLSTPVLIEWILYLSLLMVLFLKAKREERLWCGHDLQYLQYKKRTKLFIPYIL